MQRVVPAAPPCSCLHAVAVSHLLHACRYSIFRDEELLGVLTE